MARRTSSDRPAFAALAVEGNLIAPAMLAAIDRREAKEQTDADYGIPPGLTLRDEIARYFRIGQALYDHFAATASPTHEATIRFAADFLNRVFDFDDLERDTAESAPALSAGEGRVPVIVVPPSDPIDRVSPALSADGRRRSAALALQDWLNAEEPALWGLATNGHALRLMRDNASFTRPAHIEADLAQIFTTEDFASFAALWLLIHRSRFGLAGAPAADCPLERWRDAGVREGEVARERLRDGVEAALKVLGTGFLEANPELRARLADGTLPLTTWFNELLRLVYRLIFLLVAEDRELLHSPDATAEARQLYAEGYSLARLRRRAVRRTAWDRHADLYEGVKVVFRALARGEPRLGLPALGGLFAPGVVPDLDSARLANRALMEAVYRLAWLSRQGALVPVNWKAMETEELGSVYESLLELTPQLADDARALVFAEDSAETRGNQRKTTGSYYTPDSLVQALLDSALDPVLDRVEAEADDPAAALARLAVIDPACGSGHFLLAAARRIAARLARHRAGGTPSAEDYRHALRDVARGSVHGVDRNPMAVELTKVALWIETVDPGRPLGFLDANIRCGDALLGIFDLEALTRGIPDAAMKPLTGDDRETAKHFERRNRAEREGQGLLDFGAGGGRLPALRPMATRIDSFRALPEDTVAEIEEKARRFRELRASPAWYDLGLAADLYVAAFLTPKTGGVPARPGEAMIPTTAHVWEALSGRPPHGRLVGRAQALAHDARAFHWPLEFADVMARGGFDVVLGNPPWERIKLQEQEFFAARDPEIAAAPNKAARARLIAALAEAPPGSPRRALHDAFEAAKREAEAVSAFVRVPGDAGGRFPLTGRGDVNTYALFAELFASLAGAHGRAGVIVPTGIATDATTAPFFESLVGAKRIRSLFDFRNAGFFPGAASAQGVRFCLFTIGEPTDAPAEFLFRLTDVGQLTSSDRRFALNPDDIARINPNTKTAPIFRSRADAELTAKIYSNVPVLFDESYGSSGNIWNVRFMRMFDMANDSGLFRTAAQLEAQGFVREGTDWLAEGARPRQATMALSGGRDLDRLDLQGGGPRGPRRYVPLYEAKMVHHYNHRWGDFALAQLRKGADPRHIPTPSVEQLSDPNYEITPRYWVPENDVSSRSSANNWRREWFFGWRDITSGLDERTLIGSAIPLAGCNHKYLLILPDRPSNIGVCLMANMASLPADYVARQKLGGTSFGYFTMKQMPFLAPDFYIEQRLDFIVPRVLELTYTSHSMAPFARDLGHTGPPFAWDEARRAHLRAELDAFYARAYGLTRDELRYILDPAEVRGEGYPSETFRVLKTNELRRFGEYRTARLVLAAWDRMEADGEFRRLGL